MSVVRRWLLRVAAALAVLLVAWQLWILGHVLWWRDHPPASTAFMEIRAAERHSPILPHPWVAYARIAEPLKRAVVAAEDANFLDHQGFDWDGIETALNKDLKRGRIVAGGSTISQQLAKNLFLSGSRSGFRKLEEALVTVMLEHFWSKRRILEVYLNVIEWGDGVFGCEAASRHYFQTGASTLGPEQAARLAAMIPSPRFFDRNRRAPGLLRKTGIILARMPAADVP